MLAQYSLKELTLEFIASGDDETTVSIPVIDLWTTPENVLATPAALKKSFELCVQWTKEWMEETHNGLYVSPPLLIVDDADLLGYDSPRIYLRMSKDVSCYDPRMFIDALRTEITSDILATQARLSHLLVYRSGEQWLFLSELALQRMIRDFNPVYEKRSHQSQCNFLATLLANLSLCGSEYYDLNLTDGLITDLRLSYINELMIIASRELTLKYSSESTHESDYNFTADLLAAARHGDCEYQLLCAVGTLLWSSP